MVYIPKDGKQYKSNKTDIYALLYRTKNQCKQMAFALKVLERKRRNQSDKLKAVTTARATAMLQPFL